MNLSMLEQELTRTRRVLAESVERIDTLESRLGELVDELRLLKERLRQDPNE